MVASFTIKHFVEQSILMVHVQRPKVVEHLPHHANCEDQANYLDVKKCQRDLIPDSYHNVLFNVFFDFA